MSEPIYIVDYFEDIVNQVSTSLGVTVGYQYGHPKEINETLVALSKSPVSGGSAFPMVALFTDIEEKKGEDFNYDSKVSLHILIAEQTRTEYNSAERMEKTFKPVLYPIYTALIEKIAASKYFFEASVKAIPHSKTDRLHWGKSGIYGNEGLIFTENLDCIEIQNLSLTVKHRNC